MSAGASERRRKFAPALLLVALAPTYGCRALIVPPHSVADPVSVFVLDQGRHSALVLPGADGGARLWAFGEWRWYAKDETAWWRVPAVVLWPTRGTLGRAEVALPLESRALARAWGASEVHELCVERERAFALAEQLEARYRWSGAAPVYNPLYHLYFVPDAGSYWFARHCNNEVIGWLGRLGCTVSGRPLLADFAVVDGLE